MADDGFKHIKVTAADDDEVIIVGARPVASDAADEGLTQPQDATAAPTAQKIASAAEPKRSSEASTTPAPIAIEASPAPSPAVNETSAASSPSEPAPSRAEKPMAAQASQAHNRAAQARSKATKADDYHETTLEDLEGSPMPFAQKVVIVAAVVCIIGALIYYFAVLR